MELAKLLDTAGHVVRKLVTQFVRSKTWRGNCRDAMIEDGWTWELKENKLEL